MCGRFDNLEIPYLCGFPVISVDSTMRKRVVMRIVENNNRQFEILTDNLK